MVHGADRRRVPVSDVAVRRRRCRRARRPRRRRGADVRVRDGCLRLRPRREGAAEDEHCPKKPTAVDAARERRWSWPPLRRKNLERTGIKQGPAELTSKSICVFRTRPSRKAPFMRLRRLRRWEMGDEGDGRWRWR